MKRRIASMAMAFVMIFTMVASALPTFAAENSTSLTITADKTEVKAGDTVTYTVTLGAVKDLSSLKFQLDIPAGLTYVEGSGKEVEGLVDQMNSMMAKNLFTEKTKVFIVGCDPTYASDKATTLMTLQCTVDANAAGDMTLGFVDSKLECFDSKDADITCTLTGATVTVPGAHEHQFDDEWHNDAENHWHECDCGEKSEVAAHTYGEWTVTKEATETSVGSKERTCTVCGYKQVAEIPMLDHEHQFDDAWHNDAENHWHECDCGEKSEVAAHTYGDWTVTKAPTEETTGTRERTCTVCGYKQTETMPVLPHEHTYDDVWHNDETGHWHECTKCHEKDQVAAHTYGDWTVTQEPTCTVPGSKQHTCTVCGYVETVEIPTVPHEADDVWHNDENGHWHICGVCGNEIDKDSHTYGKWIVDKEATKEEPGSKHRVCEVCGYRQDAVIHIKGNNVPGNVALNFETNGGEAISARYTAVGNVIDLTKIVPAKAGYEFAGWYADKALTQKVTAVKMVEDTTVYAKWNVSNIQTGFKDVAPNAYYAPAVKWAVEKGVTTGLAEGMFGPDVVCTRAQAVTFLWHAAGSPAVHDRTNPFTDVAADAYYADAVLWAVENGITSGTSATTFAPDAECTRAQIMTFLWKSQGAPVVTAENPFTDVAADAYYANAVLWAVQNGITSGTSAATFGSDDECTRAQIVTFLYQCMGK